MKVKLNQLDFVLKYSISKYSQLKCIRRCGVFMLVRVAAARHQVDMIQAGCVRVLVYG